MTRRLAVILASLMAAGLLAACQPTGDIRCDRHAGILLEIEAHGWTTDCTPDFENQGTYDDGETWFPIWGWADSANQTVWIWPDEPPTDGRLKSLLWHELAHVRGIADEYDADVYAYCRDPAPRAGYRFSSTLDWPTAEDCERVGA